MVRVKLIYSTVVSGGVWPAGSIVEVGTDEAASLLRDGLAAEVAVSDENPHPQPLSRGERGEKVKRGA